MSDIRFDDGMFATIHQLDDDINGGENIVLADEEALAGDRVNQTWLFRRVLVDNEEFVGDGGEGVSSGTRVGSTWNDCLER